ncbi:hypothetical protein EV2_004130 [Malus domestica]
MQAMNTVFSQPSQSTPGMSSTPATSPQVWIADSGATNHMTADFNNLTLATPYPTSETVHTANGEGLTVSHIGSTILKPHIHPIKLNSILYVPKLSQNLLSVHRLCLDNNCWLIFDAYNFWIQDKATGRILFKGICSNGLYPIPSLANHHPASQKSILQPTAFLGQLVTFTIWHSRLGHPSNPIVSLMLSKAKIPCTKASLPVLCQSCLEGKFSKLPFHCSVNKAVKPFEVVHSDIWGPAPCISADGFRYYVTFIDECTRFCWLFPLINKSDLFDSFVGFYSFVLNQFSVSLQMLQSDGGGEYLSHRFQRFLKEKGISHQISCPYTPEQNGLAERKHRHLVETTITLLQNAQLPSHFWSFGCQTANYLINRMPSATLQNKSPFELLFGDLPAISHLRVFGCTCYPLLKPYNNTKLQQKTTKCVFLGYASKYKGYICYEVLSHRFYISRHVIFDELEFPYAALLTAVTSLHKISTQSSTAAPFTHPLPIPNSLNELVTFLSHSSSHTSSIPVSPSLSSHSPVVPPLHHSVSTPPSLVPSQPVTSNPVSQSITAAANSCPALPVATTFSPDSLQVVLPIPPLNLHPMQTRSKSGT